MVSQHSVLVCDDDAVVREKLCGLLEPRGFAVRTASHSSEALALLEEDRFDAILLDLHYPDRNLDLSVVGEIHSLCPNVAVILITAFGNLATASSALRAGAFDYLLKPIQPDDLAATLDLAFRVQALEAENERLRAQTPRTEEQLGDLVAASPEMRSILSLISRIAPGDNSVLITGESGTGKDVVARTIHGTGPRADRPYVAVNCAALPADLLESELFGHVRGSFSGAHADKQGLVSQADGGTLFLDEIGEMSPDVQSKLLRVLQNREVRPVGSTQSQLVNVRFIAASNQDLRLAIAEGRFRSDLFYRLNVIPIVVPPLWSRPEDVEALAKRIVAHHSTADRPLALTDDALSRLKAHSWPGNVRELENILERSIALADEPHIDEARLIFDQSDDPYMEDEGSANLVLALEEAAREGVPLRQLEDDYIATVLKLTGDNKGEAARILGVNRATLYRRVRDAG